MRSLDDELFFTHVFPAYAEDFRPTYSREQAHRQNVGRSIGASFSAK
jgi:hypothetical protein